MTKLHQLPFYSKLADLFDNIKPKDMPRKIQDVVQYLNKSLIAYEAKNGYSDDIRSKCELLKDLQRMFEDTLSQDVSWGFYLGNGKQGHQVNLRPLFKFLHDNSCIEGDLTGLLHMMTTELLNSSNVDDYKVHFQFINELIVTFDGSYAESW